MPTPEMDQEQHVTFCREMMTVLHSVHSVHQLHQVTLLIQMIQSLKK